MPSANRETLTTRIVETLPVSDRETVVWDRELPGFGVRVHPSGSKVPSASESTASWRFP